MAEAKQPSTLVSAAVSGTAWSSAQTVLARVLAGVSTIVLARLLTVPDFGFAGQAASLGAALAIFVPGPLTDVLISGAGRGGIAVQAARRASRIVGWLAALLVFVSAAAWLAFEPRSMGPWLLFVFCARPVAEAATVVPLAALRVSLRFREIAVADMAAVLGSAAIGVALAILGFGPFALAIPPVALLVFRAAGYLRCGMPALPSPGTDADPAAVLRPYWAAALAQYAHGLVVTVDVLLLSWMASSSASGLYVFSISLAMQAHSLFVLQLSSTLQPILVAMGNDLSRQFAATARAARCITAIAVPVALCQAVVSESLIRSVFGEKWVPAWPAFSVTCGSMAISAGVAPLLAYLKARGMFRFILVWQFMHLLALAAAGALALRGNALPELSAWLGLPFTDAVVPSLGMATIVLLIWAISLPLAVRCCRPSAVLPGALAFTGLLRPLIVAVPVMVGGVLARVALLRSIPSPYGDWAVVLVVAPAVFAAALFGNAAVDPRVRSDLLGVFGGIRRRLSPW